MEALRTHSNLGRPPKVAEWGFQMLKYIVHKSYQLSADFGINIRTRSVCSKLHSIGFHSWTVPLSVICVMYRWYMLYSLWCKRFCVVTRRVFHTWHCRNKSKENDNKKCWSTPPYIFTMLMRRYDCRAPLRLKYVHVSKIQYFILISFWGGWVGWHFWHCWILL